MIALLIIGLIVGAGTVEQIHYNKCKELGFKGEACQIEKNLKERGAKK